MLINFRVVNKTLWISRKMHDEILAKDIVFFEDNICPGNEPKWSLFGKGIVCATEKDAHQLLVKIMQFMLDTPKAA